MIKHLLDIDVRKERNRLELVKILADEGYIVSTKETEFSMMDNTPSTVTIYKEEEMI